MLGAGWVSALFSGERKAWSDETGTVILQSKNDYELPTIEDFTDIDKSVAGEAKEGVFEWIDEDWNVDYTWTDVDPEGWEYYNQRWENGRPSRMMGSFTRRRKWVRHMKLKLVDPAARPVKSSDVKEIK
jgi:hypothetical protein